jgi:hypothetical protein
MDLFRIKFLPFGDIAYDMIVYNIPNSDDFKILHINEIEHVYTVDYKVGGMYSSGVKNGDEFLELFNTGGYEADYLGKSEDFPEYFI